MGNLRLYAKVKYLTEVSAAPRNESTGPRKTLMGSRRMAKTVDILVHGVEHVPTPDTSAEPGNAVVEKYKSDYEQKNKLEHNPWTQFTERGKSRAGMRRSERLSYL